MREELKNMSETELNQLEEQVAEEAVTVEDIRSNLKQTKNGTPGHSPSAVRSIRLLLLEFVCLCL